MHYGLRVANMLLIQPFVPELVGLKRFRLAPDVPNVNWYMVTQIIFRS